MNFLHWLNNSLFTVLRLFLLFFSFVIPLRVFVFGTLYTLNKYTCHNHHVYWPSDCKIFTRSDTRCAAASRLTINFIAFMCMFLSLHFFPFCAAMNYILMCSHIFCIAVSSFKLTSFINRMVLEFYLIPSCSRPCVRSAVRQHFGNVYICIFIQTICSSRHENIFSFNFGQKRAFCLLIKWKN